jgi:hypothetical protein
MNEYFGVQIYMKTSETSSRGRVQNRTKPLTLGIATLQKGMAQLMYVLQKTLCISF